MTKWHWPTWADWLSAYGHKVINLGYKGYCCNQLYWILLDNFDKITAEDHVIIMWPRNDRIVQWYDQEWVEKNNCEGFFPNTEGKLWFTKDNSYLGLYRTHPDKLFSLSHSIILGFDVILQTQMLLEKIGCKYTMSFAQNPWLDGRPSYYPKFKTRWETKNQISQEEYNRAVSILNLSPVKQSLALIDWSHFTNNITDVNNVTQYTGIWEYFINNKEYVLFKHETDQHPPVIAHHDWAVNNILKLKDSEMTLRTLALSLSEKCMNMLIPEFTSDDYTADPTTQLLDTTLKNDLNER